MFARSFHRPLARRDVLTAAFGLAAGGCLRSSRPANGQAPLSPHSAESDFDTLWELCRDTYCFFDEKATDWDRVRELYRPRAVVAGTSDDLALVLDDALAELYDPHCHVKGGERPGSRRFIPFDLWVEQQDGQVVVTAVSRDSMASDAKVQPGDVVLSLDGIPIADAAQAIKPKCLAREDPAADAWSLLAALVGRRGKARTLSLRTVAGVTREAHLTPQPLTAAASEPDPPPVRWGHEGEFGYIRVESFGDESVVGLFDHALAELRALPGLVIDVRENGGGDTAYARPMMGRFIKSKMPYAWMARRDPGARALSAPWQEYVEPRGPFTYEGRVVVLTDRFSASMAEGFPMGMRGIGRAKIVGTKMAGLGAAIRTTTLPHSNLDVQLSAEPVYSVNHEPRWKMVPDVVVRLEQMAGTSDADPILSAGLATLRTGP